MFYSHTFLARKGPLGTVWCAAHLQHKLKKSHYASTDIPSTVERIMCPEVPIALRMSGHLLLGVVRIYSKKVDYLHHDCNDLWVSLRNAFRHIDVNLPENASHAQFNAVTLPDTYALDAVDIDEGISLIDGSEDNHLRSLEEITLKDQYHDQQELYVRITIDDDIIPGLSQPEQWAEGDQMQTHILPEVPVVHDTEGLKQTEERERVESEYIPPYEVIRDHQSDEVHLSSPILRPFQEDIESTPKEAAEKETDTPKSMDASIPVPSLQPPHHEGPSSPAEAHVVSDSFANVPQELELRPSPSPEKPEPRQRKRKRMQYFDESLVLSNESLRKGLSDSSGLVKKKKKLPCSALDLWRFRAKKKKNEEAFSEPLISGMCVSLENLHSKDFVSLNPNLLLRESTQLESVAAESGAQVPIVDEEIEFERLRSADHDSGQNIEQIFPSSTPLFPPSHEQGEASSSRKIPSPVSEPQFGSTDTQSDVGRFSYSTGMETPSLNIERDDDVGTATALSDIPEWNGDMVSDESARDKELSFLEEDDHSPSGSQRTRSVDTMSARTRAVAEYLKNHSPLSGVSDGSENLNLTTILEGKRRKLCARMFYETLVLKDYGLIDVQQDEPYGDIILKLTSTFSTAKI